MPPYGLIRMNQKDSPPPVASSAASQPSFVPASVYATGELDGESENDAPADMAAGQSPAALQGQAAAVFPQDDGHPVTVFFAADTAFDCEDGDSASGWPPGED